MTTTYKIRHYDSRENPPEILMHGTVSDTAAKAVEFEFNPSANEKVTRLKALAAAYITEVENIRSNAIREDNAVAARRASVAITEMEAVSMRAVSSIFG